MALEDESWHGITLGEGMTPVIRLDEHVLLKMDYLMPTLSYKDRGAAVLMAHCKSLGIDRVVQDSSGNAGNSIAAYAARAGIACEIFVPEGTSPKKISMIRAHGAICTIVPGSRDHCAQVCREKMEKEGIFYASHVYNPFFYEGTKTYVYEVFEQLGRIPRHLVIPVGNGTLFLGVMKALSHLQESGLLDRMPQIIAVQSEPAIRCLRAQSRGWMCPPPSPPAPLWRKESPSGSPCGERKSYLWQRNTACALSTRRRTGFFRPGIPRGKRCVLRAHHSSQLCGVSALLRMLRGSGRLLITMCGAGLKSDH